jgi:uncharacterized repeat protein (TIGR01451 family)
MPSIIIDFPAHLGFTLKLSKEMELEPIPLRRTEKDPMNLRSIFWRAALWLLLTQTIRLNAQNITSVDPPLGSHGDFIRIFGSGFTPNNHLPNTLSVFFNNVLSTSSTNSVNLNGTEIDITNVPVSASSGPIKIILNGITFFSPEDFVIISTNAYVTNFIPLHGASGTHVLLQGVHMSFVTNASFNGITGSLISGPTANSVTVQAPASTSGPLQTISKFGVTHAFNTRSNVFYSATNFFYDPSITSFTPASGRPGTNIVITGVNFTASAGVKFGSLVVSDFTISNNTTIRVAVPTNASTGKITVLPPAISDPMPSAVSTGNFSMLPTIYSFSPNLGTPGTIVTLLGSGLNEKSPNPTVTVGAGTVTSFSTVTPTNLIFTVPVTATSGLIVVTTTNGTFTSGQIFYLPASITSFTPTNGPAGTIVKITGNNFTNASAVLFNGIPATSFAVTNNTTIGAVVPPGITSGPISVTTPFGTTNSAALFFAAPTVTGFTPSHGSAGTNVMITGTSFTNATAVLFNGIPSSSFVVTNDSILSAVVPLNATTGKITVTGPGGSGLSANDFIIDTSDLAIDVNSAPNPVFVGSNLVYTIVVTNGGPVPALNVVVTNLLPSSVLLKSATTTQGSLATNSNPVFATLGSLNNNSSATILLTVAPFTPGIITNFAFVGTDSVDTNLANNASAAATFVWPLPVLSITNLGSNNLLKVSWPAPLSGFTLQFKGNLSSNILWSNDLTPKTITGTNVSVIETNIGTPRFFRLTN